MKSLVPPLQGPMDAVILLGGMMSITRDFFGMLAIMALLLLSCPVFAEMDIPTQAHSAANQKPDDPAPRAKSNSAAKDALINYLHGFSEYKSFNFDTFEAGLAQALLHAPDGDLTGVDIYLNNAFAKLPEDVRPQLYQKLAIVFPNSQITKVLQPRILGAPKSTEQANAEDVWEWGERLGIPEKYRTLPIEDITRMRKIVSEQLAGAKKAYDGATEGAK